MSEIVQRVGNAYSTAVGRYGPSIAHHGQFFVAIDVLTKGLRDGLFRVEDARDADDVRWTMGGVWPIRLDRSLELGSIEWRLPPVVA